ncbi:MAG: hypothetical protein ACLFSQ_08585 [Candidatus Zixiibacteriota bacterium]
MKKAILVIFLAITIAYSFSIIYPSHDLSFATSIVECNDSTGFIVNSYYSTRDRSMYKMVVFKIDSFGSIIWQREFPEDGFAASCDIVKTDDGNYACAGTYLETVHNRHDFYMVKINSTGDVIWENHYGSMNTNERCFFMNQAHDNGFLMSGFGDFLSTDTMDIAKKAYIVRVDSLGEQLWTDIVYESESVALKNASFNDSLHITIALKTALEDSVFIVFHDVHGDTVRTIFNEDRCVNVQKRDSVFLLSHCGTPVSLLNSSFEVIWSIDSIYDSNAFFLNDGRIAIKGFAGESYREILIYTREGEFVRSFPELYRSKNIIETTNKGFIAVGTTRYTGQIVITKTDSLGNINNEYDIDLQRGWNMVSYPYDSSVSYMTLFPSIDYRNIYQYVTESRWYDRPWDGIEAGMGLFVLSERDTTVTIDGKYRMGFLDIVLHRGWNMIGTPAQKIPADTLNSIYGDDFISPFYYFVPGSGYVEADTLYPCHAYWIMTLEDSVLVRMR